MIIYLVTANGPGYRFSIVMSTAENTYNIPIENAPEELDNHFKNILVK
ncbi:MAG TPA: hypothetical protein VFM28_07560 [Nitrososphaeraceae archaeon]|nr:hypothetical protein [Nitrososphaeraceae archaeon]